MGWRSLGWCCRSQTWSRGTGHKHLQRCTAGKGGELRAEPGRAPNSPPQQSLSAHACRGPGPAPSHTVFLPSPDSEETPVHITRGSAKEGCRRAALKPGGALVYPGNEASQAFLFFLSTDLAFLIPWGVTRSQSEGGSRKPGREALLSRLAAHGWACSLSVHPLTHLSGKTPDITHTQEA